MSLNQWGAASGRVVLASAVAVTVATMLLLSRSAHAVTHQQSLVVLGSSSIGGSFGKMIAGDFKRLGFQVSRYAYPSAGLARPDFLDLRGLLERMSLDENTRAVLLYVGGNDGQSIWKPEQPGSKGTGWVSWRDKRWSSIYESRARALLESLCARRVQHAIVMAPIDVTRPRLQARLPRIRTALRRAAHTTSCAHFVSTAGDEDELETQGSQLRAADGVHMTRAGAVRVWKRIRGRVLGFMDVDANADRLLDEPDSAAAVSVTLR